MTGAYGLNFAVKLAVRRRRPELPDLLPADIHGVAAVLSPAPTRRLRSPLAAAYRDLVPGGWLYGAREAILFALTRPYLGVHYPSDVLVGRLWGPHWGRRSRVATARRLEFGGAGCR